jgi:hypothetical protein
VPGCEIGSGGKIGWVIGVAQVAIESDWSRGRVIGGAHM